MCVQNHLRFLCFFFKKYHHLLLQNDPFWVWCFVNFHFILTLRWSNWYRHYRLIHGLHTYLGGLTSALKTHLVLFSYCMVLLSTSPLHLPGRHTSDSLKHCAPSPVLLLGKTHEGKLSEGTPMKYGLLLGDLFFQDKIQASCHSSGSNWHNRTGVSVTSVHSWAELS